MSKPSLAVNPKSLYGSGAVVIAVLLVSMTLLRQQQPSVTSGQGAVGSIALPIVLKASSSTSRISIDQSELQLPSDTVATKSVVSGNLLYEIIDGDIVAYRITDPSNPRFVARSFGGDYTDIFATEIGVVCVGPSGPESDNVEAPSSLRTLKGSRVAIVGVKGSAIEVGEGGEVAGNVTAVVRLGGQAYVATTSDAWLDEPAVGNGSTGLISATVSENKIGIDGIVFKGRVDDMAIVGSRLYLLDAPRQVAGGASNSDPAMRVVAVDVSTNPPTEVDSIDVDPTTAMLGASRDGIFAIGSNVIALKVAGAQRMSVASSYPLGSGATAVVGGEDDLLVGIEGETADDLVRLKVLPDLVLAEAARVSPGIKIQGLSRIKDEVFLSAPGGTTIARVPDRGGLELLSSPKKMREWYHDVATAGTTVYALDWWGEVSILHVADGTMVEIGRISVEGHEDESAIAVAATSQFVAVALSSSVIVYDVSNLSDIRLIGELTNLLSVDFLYHPIDMVADGSMVAVLVGSPGIMIIDVSDRSVKLRETLAPIVEDPGPGVRSLESTSIALLGPMLYDLGATGWLRKSDVSSSPVEVSRIHTGAIGGRLSLLDAGGVMVVSKTAGGIEVVDVSGSKMTLINTLDAADANHVVDMTSGMDSIMTVSSWSPGVRRIRVEHGDAIDETTLSGVTWAWRCAGVDGVFVVSLGNQLILVDVRQGELVVVDRLIVAG